VGLILAGVRLGVLLFWVLWDWIGHLDLAFLQILIACGFVVFPEGFLLEHWFRTHGQIPTFVATSFLVASSWVLLTNTNAPPEPEAPSVVPAVTSLAVASVIANVPPITCRTCGLTNPGLAERCDCGSPFTQRPVHAPP